MMKKSLLPTITVAALGVFAADPFQLAHAQAEPGAERGELLYSNYCQECHRAEIHWRDKRLANDWPSLYAQVKRWQRNSKRSWDPGDTRAIAAYLNERFYHFAPGDDIRN